MSAAGAVAASALPLPALGLQSPGRAGRGLGRGELQALLDDAARTLGVVGAQLAVFDGERVIELATGMADREPGLDVTVDTLFQIGSTTKVFNAATIMTLVDEGMLDLDEPVRTWIADFRLADAEATRQTTLRRLLSMSAGIDNGPYTEHGRGDDALDRYVASLAELPQIFAPGTAFGYSNAASCVAGLAAERATGKNWETLLEERILRPLGLAHTASFPEDLLFHPLALGYSYPPGSSEPRRVPVWALPRSMAPAGATLCASAGDLVRFARMFLDDGRSADGEPVVSSPSVRTMHTPQVELPAKLIAQQWCTGPYWKRWGGEVIYGHSGTNTGGSSLLLWCPTRNVAAATIASVPSQGYPLADRVFETVFPEAFGIAKPKLPKPDSVDPVEVDPARFVGRFEALGQAFSFSVEGDALVARAEAPSELVSELIPLGDDRFLPRDPAMGGNRGWDVAFWGDDGHGRATHYLNGVFALRRAS